MSIDLFSRRGIKLLRPKYLATLIFVAIALFSIVHDKFLEKRRAEAGYVRVTHVHDGDTVNVIIGNREERVRLIGIDAPELTQEPWGRKAKGKLQELIGKTNKTVRLEMDVEERDKYGRLLSYLWTKDGRLINEEMVRRGYAFVYTIPPNVKYVERLQEAQKTAQKKKVGLWAKDGLGESPSAYRKKHPRY